MATSGTVATTVFQTRKVIDHAFRRIGLAPQQVTSEHIDTALDLLFLELSALGNRGIPLWTIERILLPIYYRTARVPTPLGTIDVFNVNLRTNQRLSGANTASEGDADNAFDADIDTACTQVTPAGDITMTLDSASTVPIFGLLPNVTGIWDITFQFSDDGITYTDIFTRPELAVTNGEWFWADVEGLTNHLYWRLQANGLTVLDVRELVFQNTPQEIPFYKLNRDDYSNLPNKTRTGRPTQFWYDKTRQNPEIVMWPNPDSQFTFSQLTGFLHRQIQDVGTMQQEVECPQRWYLAITMQLAKHLIKEIKEADKQLIPVVEQDAAYELARAWDGEGDGSDVFLRVNIRPYTA
tara:strand:+ start:323 stop:1378 length:1056 start_codon:yes stop_codon:yes gene_type:complete